MIANVRSEDVVFLGAALASIVGLLLSLYLAIRFWQLILNMPAWQKRQLELQENIAKNLHLIAASLQSQKKKDEP
jgi:hypothetical protein